MISSPDKALSSSDARADVLHALADALHAAYDVSLSMATLEETISLYEQILRLRPAGHESRASALNNLGDSLYHFCCRHGLDQTRSDRCIEILREALQLRPPGHPLRAQSLHNLARSLRSIHYKQLGNLEILVECASLNREALELRPAGDPERLKSMNNLANDLRLIVDHTADAEILAEMVSIRREVLSMRPPGHSLRHTSLHNLGIALYSSFEQLGGSDILAEAIGTVREAMQLRPPGHSQRFSVLHNLAYALSLRFTYEGHLDSLLESICLSRKALHLLPEHHPERCEFLNNLADSLLASFRHSGDGAALMEAISLLREAMILRSPGGFAHDDTLNNLAEALEAKYDQDRSDVEVLSEAAQLHRDALQFRPTGHSRRFWSLEGLARVLCKIGFQSWPEALSCYQGALQLCPASYPGRSRLQSGMSICFLDPNSPFFSISQGISCLSEAYADSFSHVNERLKAAIIDLQRLEAAYVASTQGAQTGPPTKDDEKVLNLYSQVIGLLPLAANFGLDHNARLHALMGCDEISRNAAARAMLSTCLPQAVELLEQGRNVFWTQTLHLRMATFDGVPDADCQELKRMLRLLHHGTRRIESLEQSVSQREHELEKRRQLNEAVQILISQIRGHPGLDRFLLPPAFDALFGSLPNGFVAIVNASKLGHHALLLHRATGVVTCLALRPFRTGFDFATLRAQLPRDMSIIPEHHGEIKARAMRVDKGGVDDLEDVLSTLWASVVQPVLEALGLNVSKACVTAYSASLTV
jgi:tetratricopeptide (TPR) repeat protein